MQADLDTTLINLQRCDESSIEEVLKMAPKGSILDSDTSASIVVDRIGDLIAEAISDVDFHLGNVGYRSLQKFISAIGDCSEGIIGR